MQEHAVAEEPKERLVWHASIRIPKITVLLRDNHMDLVTIDLDMRPSILDGTGEIPSASVQATAGYGVQWVKENFSIEPEVIDARRVKR